MPLRPKTAVSDTRSPDGSGTTDSVNTAQRHNSPPTSRRADFAEESHKGAGVRETTQAAGAELLFLPTYSPDLNLIEMAFSKLKAHLRKVAELTVEGLCGAIARTFEIFQPQECRNYFAAVG